IDMVIALSAKSGTPVDELVQAFGVHLMGRFKILYPAFFQDKKDSFEFLEGIEDTIHTEVRKLYPTAELPNIDWKLINENCMEIHYNSNRPFSALAVGLIKGCIQHFNEEADIKVEGSANKAVITINRSS
ncbi:MAG: heme NO-binding domain-containing protein, partial [Magnetococcales bacterium]|nr:heme NO-binding domain-containing protein [Magnetococcales bacterium]